MANATEIVVRARMVLAGLRRARARLFASAPSAVAPACEGRRPAATTTCFPRAAKAVRHRAAEGPASQGRRIENFRPQIRLLAGPGGPEKRGETGAPVGLTKQQCDERAIASTRTLRRARRASRYCVATCASARPICISRHGPAWGLQSLWVAPSSPMFGGGRAFAWWRSTEIRPAQGKFRDSRERVFSALDRAWSESCTWGPGAPGHRSRETQTCAPVLSWQPGRTYHGELGRTRGPTLSRRPYIYPPSSPPSA